MSEEEQKPKWTRGKHPNSLASLQRRPWTSEEARDAQKLGQVALSKKRAEKKKIKEQLKLWKEVISDVKEEGINGMDTLKMLLARALADEDMSSAENIAAKLAEYEKPKLARQEVKVEDTKAETMTDEELDAKLKSLLGPKDPQ